MCFERKFVFLCKKRSTLKKYFLADSKKKMMLTLRGGLLVVVFKKPLAFSSAKMRVVISFVSPRYSQHIVGLWKKEIQRVSKNKSNSLSGRKGFFHNNAGNGKKLRAKQNRDGSPRFFEATKNIEPLEKTKRGLQHKCVLY